ncbi:TIGR04141 family sporadically distributed protein [Lentzea nigeriaca]|uniref:TIGR04141 family sporadically distributed protein n=1 Tax=Lentzea nigeriaca TaxID=1128665 RepID=UPI001956D4D0|nr:TIGR04141 family sporadically distributed protein [Lentzea nigeriaca]MBM7860754.1 uncharacterized protein (TIGR04141 family) [Lentzea nigeriaca]
MPDSPSLPTTVFQLVPGHPMTDYVSRPHPPSSFEVRTVDADDGRWSLMCGCLKSDNVTWARHIWSLTGEEIALETSTPFGVLFVPRPRWNYAFVWGAGWQLVNPDLVVADFGKEYGQRRLDTGSLRSIGSRNLDLRGRITQTTIPSGSDLRDFAIEPVLSTINHLEGTAHLNDLTAGKHSKRSRKIRVGRSLRLPLGRTPETLVDDLESLERARESEGRSAAWKTLAQLEPVHPNEPVHSALEAALAEALGQEDGISIGWPAGLGFNALDCDWYRITGIVLGEPEKTGEIEPGYFIRHLVHLAPPERINRMRSARIFLHDDEDSSARSTSAYRWIVLETTVEDRRYLLQDGVWYRLDGEAVQQLRGGLAELIDNLRITYPDLPTWDRGSADGSENTYCEQVSTLPGFTCLDTKLISTPMRSKVEICDLLGPNGELIHVKWLESAASASHLFEQARLAMRALKEEPEHVLAAVRQRVAAVTCGRRTIEQISPTIVLAAGRRTWHIDSLFTMSQVGLQNLERDIRALGGSLRLLDLPFAR